MMKSLEKRQFFRELEKLAKERILQSPVVNLNQFKKTQFQSSKTILILESHEAMRLSLKSIFEQEGYQVIALKEVTALTSFDELIHFDLIIIETTLPLINGFEFASILKSYPTLKSIPLIFVSEKKDREEIKKGFEVGADNFISKPFDVSELRRSVQVLLKIKKPIDN